MSLQLRGRGRQEARDNGRVTELMRAALDGFWGRGNRWAPDLRARRRKPEAGRGALRRVWEGRGGIMLGDATHPDFIKGAVIREPDRASSGASGSPPCVPTIQVTSLQPSSQDPAKVGTQLAHRTWDCHDPGRVWRSRPPTQGQLKHQGSKERWHPGRPG